MKFHYQVGWILVNLLVRILFGLKKYGTDNIPKKGGVLIACNHIDVYDPPLVGCAIQRELYFLAKKELFNNSLFAWVIRKYNAIPISRNSFDRKGIKTAIDILKAGKALVTFPEGTRSKGSILGEFKLGVAKLALDANVSIIPACLYYSSNFLKSFFQRKSIKIYFGPPINPKMFTLIPGNKEGYQKVTQEIMRKIGYLKEDIMNQDGR